MRSSAVDEDGAEASFAGQHLTLLNVPSAGEVSAAVREIWWSANSDSAITYRQRVGLFTRPSVGVVVQALLDPDSAGVMFTRNPISGADERVIEASWGLGEAVVAGLVIPDHFRLDRSGGVLERTPGRKQLAIRTRPAGGTFEEEIPAELRRAALPRRRPARRAPPAGRAVRGGVRARTATSSGRFAGGQLYLLQCRAITRPEATRCRWRAPPSTSSTAASLRSARHAELEQIAPLFKERRFSEGETVIKEGSGGAAFYLIDAGEATVTIEGEQRATLGPGDYFGEVALIDEGARIATITASTDLLCWGLTLWEFRPLVEANGVIAWKLLQTLAKDLREAEQVLASLRSSLPAAPTT